MALREPTESHPHWGLGLVIRNMREKANRQVASDPAETSDLDRARRIFSEAQMQA